MVIVIGGTSFIGKYLVKQLHDSGKEVLATGRGEHCSDDILIKHTTKYMQFRLENISDIEKLPTENVEAVILLAARMPANSAADLVTFDDASDYFEENTIGTINLLEYCRRNQIKRLISTTSYADTFMNWSVNPPVTEETERRYKRQGDHAMYVASKTAALDAMEYYNNQYGMLNVVFRLPPVYGFGPHGSYMLNGQKVSSGIQIFIDKAKAGENICVYGNKDAERDIVYVKDVASAFVRVLKSASAKGLYNISSGQTVTLERQAKAINNVFGNGQCVITYAPEKDNGITEYCLCIDKARREFGYEPLYADFELQMLDWKKCEENGYF